MRIRPILVFYCAVTVLGLVKLAEWADPPPVPGAGCRVTYVIDGDTVVLACPDGDRHGRLIGIDTPEMSGQCPAETTAAQAARKALQAMVAAAEVTEVTVEGSDAYGRSLVRLRLDGRDAARAMIAAGHGRRYDGGQREGWC